MAEQAERRPTTPRESVVKGFEIFKQQGTASQQEVASLAVLALLHVGDQLGRIADALEEPDAAS